MKRILITGFNTAQCTRDCFLRQQLKVVPSHYGLIRCLEDMGYEVEQRPVFLGEDLSHYDDVIVYLHTIHSFSERLFAALYAISARPNCILAFDDWQIDQIYGSVSNYKRDLVENEDNAFREYFINQYRGTETPQVIRSFKTAYMQACDIILNKNNRLLISAFAGGDTDLLNLEWQKDRVFTFNPNPYHLNRKASNNYGEEGQTIFIEEMVTPERKMREFNFASLVQKKTKKWLQKQNISKWKINYYGAKQSDDKQPRLVESDMCAIYNKQWGCLMPGYFHSGSGWWRARPLQVADAHSILICDDNEGKIYGPAYVGLTAHDVENMDLEKLIKTARWQRECLYEFHPLDKSITQKELTNILEASK